MEGEATLKMLNFGVGYNLLENDRRIQVINRKYSKTKREGGRNYVILKC